MRCMKRENYKHMKKNLLFTILFPLLMAALVSACSDRWEEHTALNEDVQNISLLAYLEEQSEYSEFVSLLKSTTWADSLSSSLLYTVFPPTNEAMNAMASIPQTAEEKALFVAHHIVEGRLALKSVKEPMLKMKSRKRLLLDVDAAVLDGVELDASPSVVLNGNAYSMAQALEVRPTVWEYLSEQASSNKQVDFVHSLTGRYFDEESSEATGYNEDGQVIYDSVFVDKNLFNMQIADLASEDSAFTYIIVGDVAWQAEFEKFSPYFRRHTDKRLDPDGRDSVNIQMEVLRDYCFDQAYAPEEFSGTLVSPSGVSIVIDPAKVISSFRASNGYVYVMEDCPIPLEAKILPVKIEAEQLERYFGYDVDAGSAQGYLRINPKASGGKDFVLDNHGSKALVEGLVLSGGALPSAKYRVYWRAVNNFRTSMRNPTDVVLQQRLGTVKPIERDEEGVPTDFGLPITGSVSTTFHPVELTEYSDDPEADEFFVGTFNNPTFEEVFFQLIPDGESYTRMAVTLDYIQLVPEFN